LTAFSRGVEQGMEKGRVRGMEDGIKKGLVQSYRRNGKRKRPEDEV
jgi:hypothetical protein